MCVMKKQLSLALSLIFSTTFLITSAQTTIWKETFNYSIGTTSATKGIASWTSDGYDAGFLGVYVNNGYLFGKNTATPNPDRSTWQITTGNPIEIAGFTDVSITMNMYSSGNLESSDYIQIQYSLNGGASWNNFSTNGYVSGNFSPQLASQYGLSGSTLLIRVIMINQRNFSVNEYHYIDNVTVKGIAPPPTISSLSTNNTCPGQSFTVFGSNFTDVQQVKIGNVVMLPSSYVVNNPTSITITVPNNTISGSVSVVTSGGTVNGPNLNTELQQLIWNGSVSTDWNNPNNWTPSLVPNVCSNITIPVSLNQPSLIGVTNIANLDLNSGTNVIVPTGSYLVVESDLNMYSASNIFSAMVAEGTVIVSGDTKYHRYVNSNILGNDLISSPLAGQTWSSFLDPVNATALLHNQESPIDYLFGPFNKTTGDYENYNFNTTATLTSGVGYRAATNTGETLTFTGTIPSTDISVDIIDATTSFSEWNLVGNPYPSYLNVQAFLNHQVGSGVPNINLFTDANAAIYGYDGNAQNGWTIYNLANTNATTVMAPGQGFFVAADAANVVAYDLEFTRAMQSTGDSDDFIAGRNAELIYIKLGLSSNTNTYSTDVYFNANASQGLDKGYDAALWGTDAPEFSIYSHLVQDNVGKPIALQTLNATDLTEVSIPLGVNANQGEQITFSIAEMTLPASVNVYLDDVVANTTTLLNNSDYIITPTTNLSGTGRFFLRTSDDALSTIDNNQDTLNIFALNSSKEVVVTGQLQNTTTLELYDIQGRKVLATPLDNSVLENRIDVSSLSGGVYVVNIKNNTQQKTQKVIIK